MLKKTLAASFSVLFSIFLFSGCARPVMLYTDADSSKVQALTAPFTRETGIPVNVISFTDVREMADAIAVDTGNGYSVVKHDEKYDPYADVVFSSDMELGDVLKARGVLREYAPAAAVGIPEGAKADGWWYGLGGQAWVLAWDTDRVKDPPKSLFDLTQSQYAGSGAALINPNYILYYPCGACAIAGQNKVVPFLQKLIDNKAKWFAKPQETAQDVADGAAAVCLTTMEQAKVQQKKGAHIAFAVPDQGPGQMGAYVQYNVICLTNVSTQPDQAKKLEEYLLAPETEALSVKLGLSSVTMRRCGSEAPVVRPLDTDLSSAAAAMQNYMGGILTYFTKLNPQYTGE